MPDISSELGDTSLPKLPKAESLKRYRRRVKDAQAWRTKQKYDQTWKRLIDMYRGKQFEAATSTEDRIAINIAFATINVIEPSISLNFPKITVNATSPDDEDQATITEAVINYWWRHQEIKPEFRRAAKDFLITGHGWLKVGWRYAEGMKDRKAEDVQNEQDMLKAQADQHALDNPDQAGDLPSDEDIHASVPTEEPYVITDHPFVERVSPFDMYVDPEATCISDMKWIAQRVIRPLEDVKADDRYGSAVRSRLKSDSTRADAPTTDPKDSKNDDIKRVTLWEFYDMQRRTVCVFTEQGDDKSEFLIPPEPMPYSYGMPFVMLRSYEVPDQFYPIGDLEMLEPLQGELNKTRSAMMNNRKRYARKYLYQADLISPSAADALVSDADGALVPVEGNVDLKNVVLPVPQTPLDAQMYQYSETIISDTDRVSGISEYERGTDPTTRRTATEVSIVQDAANSRAQDKLAQIEDVVRHVAFRLVALAQTYMSGQQVIRVVGPSGNIWVPFSKDDIQGEFDFEVEAGSTQPRNETQRRQQAMQMFNTLVPLIAPNGPVDAVALVTNLLRDGFDIKNPQQYLAPPPPPMQIDPATGQPLPPEALPGGPQGAIGPGATQTPQAPNAHNQAAQPGHPGFNGAGIGAPNFGGAAGPGAQK